MADLSALTNQTSTAQSLSDLILVTPDSNQGITSQTDQKIFLFDYEGENSISLESDVTDHTIENNSTIQDHIALKPEIINVTGFIGELNDIPPPALALLKTVADKLVLLAPFTPALSIAALRAYNNASLLYNTAASVATAGVSAWNSLTSGAPTQTKQQTAFIKFYGYWQNRTFFTVQTPWAIFDNMIIKSLRAIQDEETRVISSFEISFKKIRYARTITRKPKKLQARLNSQAAIIADNGTSTPQPGAPLTTQVITSGVPA